jgi:hypothetical protein
LLALCVAYSLVIQAMMASLGLGMSAGAAPDLVGFVLCSFAFHWTTPAPGDGQTPTPAPPCPFCFVAAQTANHVAAGSKTQTLPDYANVLIAAMSRPLGDGTFVPQFHHSHGEPRAPPAFSV